MQINIKLECCFYLMFSRAFIPFHPVIGGGVLKTLSLAWYIISFWNGNLPNRETSDFKEQGSKQNHHFLISTSKFYLKCSSRTSLQMRLPQRGISKYIIPKVGRKLALVVLGGHWDKIPKLKFTGTIFGKKNPNSYCQRLLLLIHKNQRTLLCHIPWFQRNWHLMIF